MVLQALETVLPIFALIALGRLLARRGLFPPGTSVALSRLVFFVAAPVLIFRGLATSAPSESLDARSLLTVAAVSALTALLTLVSCRRSAPARRGVLAQGAFRSNTVMIGLPVVTYALGEEALAPAAALVGVTVVTYNLLAVLALTVPKRGTRSLGTRLGSTALDVLRNPLVVASLAGAAVALAHLPIATSVERSLELLGRMTVPLALLVIGADLDLRALRNDLRPACLVAAVKLVGYPGLVAAALWTLGTPTSELVVPVLVTAAPTAVISVVMAREMGGDERLATSIVVTSTLGAGLTLPLWLVLLGA